MEGVAALLQELLVSGRRIGLLGLLLQCARPDLGLSTRQLRLLLCRAKPGKLLARLQVARGVCLISREVDTLLLLPRL